MCKVFQHIEEQKHVLCVISGDWNQICLTVTLSNQFELISVDKVRQCHCIMGWWTLSDDVKDRRQPISLNPLILPISLFLWGLYFVVNPWQFCIHCWIPKHHVNNIQRPICWYRARSLTALTSVPMFWDNQSIYYQGLSIKTKQITPHRVVLWIQS